MSKSVSSTADASLSIARVCHSRFRVHLVKSVDLSTSELGVWFPKVDGRSMLVSGSQVQQHLEQLSLENGQLSMAVILQLMVPDVVVSGVASSQSAALCNGSILVSACAGVGKVMDGKEESCEHYSVHRKTLHSEKAAPL